MNEDMVERWILPHLSKGKRGFAPKLDLRKVVLLILKRMKTGCQWRELSIREYFTEGAITWQGVYHHFHKWSKDGSFKQAWIHLLANNKRALDMSSVQLDGSHTPAKRGGEYVGYQGRKHMKTTNHLYLCDNNGQMLSVSAPQSGEHNDLFDIEAVLKEMLAVLEQADISCTGVFLNADPGFDSDDLQQFCEQEQIALNVKSNKRNKKNETTQYKYFDDELYKRRTKIEHANAWMDAFKALLVRYETRAFTWMGLQWLALISLFYRKLKV